MADGDDFAECVAGAREMSVRRATRLRPLRRALRDPLTDSAAIRACARADRCRPATR